MWIFSRYNFTNLLFNLLFNTYAWSRAQFVVTTFTIGLEVPVAFTDSYRIQPLPCLICVPATLQVQPYQSNILYLNNLVAARKHQKNPEKVFSICYFYIITFVSACTTPSDCPYGGTNYQCNANQCECPIHLVEDVDNCVGMLPFEKNLLCLDIIFWREVRLYV